MPGHVSGPRIAVVGEYRDDHETHPATTASITFLGATATWIATDEVDDLSSYDGILIAPGSPYRSVDGALAAIAHARTTATPLLGTCAGFQYLVLEFARNVLGVADAQHAEYDPGASNLFITNLACEVAGKDMDVSVVPGTRAAAAYGQLVATERYYCHFGLNPSVLPALTAGGLAVSGIDQDDEVRIVELSDHPFFVGTLFVPQVSPSPHPLVIAFITAARR